MVGRGLLDHVDHEDIDQPGPLGPLAGALVLVHLLEAVDVPQPLVRRVLLQLDVGHDELLAAAVGEVFDRRRVDPLRLHVCDGAQAALHARVGRVEEQDRLGELLGAELHQRGHGVVAVGATEQVGLRAAVAGRLLLLLLLLRALPLLGARVVQLEEGDERAHDALVREDLELL